MTRPHRSDEDSVPLEYGSAEPPSHSRIAVPFACVGLVGGLIGAFLLVSMLTTGHGSDYFGIATMVELIAIGAAAGCGVFFGFIGWSESLGNEREFGRRLSVCAMSLSGIVLLIAIILVLASAAAR